MNKPIEIEIKVKENGKIKKHKFKIYGVIDTEKRLDEIGELPKTPEGWIDNWLIAKILCEKDGGRLPSRGELAIIAALQEAKLLNTDFYGYFWSASEVSASVALRRSIYDDYSNWSQNTRYRAGEPLCLGD